MRERERRGEGVERGERGARGGGGLDARACNQHPNKKAGKTAMREASFLIFNLHLEGDGRGHRDKTLPRMGA